MSRDDRAIHLNTELLALYLRLANPQNARDDGAAVSAVLAVRDAVQPQDDPALAEVFDRYVRLIGLHLSPEARARMEAGLAEGRAAATGRPSIPPAFETVEQYLGPIRPEGRPGISLVTCAMNRTQNLLRALPSWLANPEISEIVVVDWSSDMPVAYDIAAAAKKIRDNGLPSFLADRLSQGR